MAPESEPTTEVTDVQGVFSTLYGKLMRWLEGLVAMLPNIVAAIVVLGLFVFVSRWIGRGVQKAVHGVSHNRPFSELLGTIARFATIAIGFFIALGLLQLDKTVTSLLAGVGVVGLALGFAFQDIAANFMSGFIMAIRRPFDVGDLIKTGEHFGKVLHVDLRATLMETLDGLSVIVPNKEVFQNPIVNYTHTKRRRMELTIGTAYADDLEKVRRVTIEAVQDIPHRDKSRDVEVLFSEFGDSSINFDLRVWLSASDQMSYLVARSEAMIAIKKAYDREGITIPFPIRTLDFGAGVVGGVRLDSMTLNTSQESRTQRD